MKWCEFWKKWFIPEVPGRILILLAGTCMKSIIGVQAETFSPYVSLSAGLGSLQYSGALNEIVASPMLSPRGAVSLTLKQWVFSAEVQFAFSRKIQVDPLAPFAGPAGLLWNMEGLPAFVRMEERFWTAGVGVYRRIQPFEERADRAFFRYLAIYAGGRAGWVWRYLSFRPSSGEVPWLENRLIRRFLGGFMQGPAGELVFQVRYEDPWFRYTFGLWMAGGVAFLKYRYSGWQSGVSLPWNSIPGGVYLSGGLLWYIPIRLHPANAEEEIFWE